MIFRQSLGRMELEDGVKIHTFGSSVICIFHQSGLLFRLVLICSRRTARDLGLWRALAEPLTKLVICGI